jgi:hypothetical protein
MFLAITPVQVGEFLEGMTMACFGLSWPFAIYRTWKAKRVEGKSLVFLVVVLVGYLFGIASKFVKAAGGANLEKVTILYALNALLVGVDLCLYMRYRSKNAAAAAAKETLSSPVE